jgi:predicted TIM-barrel fold metal-dependent hydrolase
MREGELRPTTAELRLTDMDRDGADASVMYGPTDPMAIADPELRRCCYEAYNDWLIDFCAARPERLIGVAQLSMEDPAFARDELERLAQTWRAAPCQHSRFAREPARLRRSLGALLGAG